MINLPSPAQIAWMKEHVDDTRVPGMIAVTSICGVASIIFVSLRFIARRMARVKPQLNDWLLLVALIHIAGEVLYCVSLAFVKFGILSLYIVIFPGKKIRWTAIAVGTFVALWTLAASLVTIFQCVPIESIWDPAMHDGNCVNFGVLALVHNICNIVTDLAIFVMPIPPVLKLKLPRERKIYVLLSFLLGASACVVSVVRTAYTLDIGSTVDNSWDMVPGANISIAEIMAGILAACIPTYGPLVHYISGKRRATRDKLQYKSASRLTSQESHELALRRGDAYKSAHSEVSTKW
ncbi:hypothetical protein AAL_02458 [Moelleriella libera RCEF 2490]|uniref:Rhodopsin domain-containing protein n=1 Tax=Moelleriella libera RCEF 2490 TaxID=1081109 RepID=A0A168EKV6_9HYPO|nr:hypothetical protein AAL_02458 [Moelleriella libera RCEF 2490]